jgi:hypothetical protein
MSLFERCYVKFSALLPGGVAFRMDLLRPSVTSGLGPMNGQRKRQQLVRELVGAVAFDEIVETGSYRGATTQFLHHVSGLPVHSAEVESRYYRCAAARCRPYVGIRLHDGDSRDMLRCLSERDGDPTLFFYLDAHWQEDVPRYQELEIIEKRWRRAVVMVDDFHVPHDPGYAFTSYGGVPLTTEYLPDLPGWRAFYPAADSAEETGAVRGCIVLAAPDMAPAIDQVTLLRPGDLVPRQAAQPAMT